jgi:hypothetical protein
MRMGLPYLWDYDLDEAQFLAILNGEQTAGRLDSDWAAIRLLEYAPYPEIIRLLGYKRIVESWTRWKPKIKSASRRRGFDFLVDYLPKNNPELIR